MRIDTAIARDTLKTGVLNVRGKGGLERGVPINEQVRIALRDSLAHIKPGQKLFVPEDKETHTVIKEFQRFIREHREKFRFPDSDGKAPITFHGLRHTYATEEYIKLRRAGNSKLGAKKKLAVLLGHSRPDIVDIYTASVDESQFGDGGGGDV